MLNGYSIKVKLILTLLSASLVTPIGLLAYILLIENQVQEQQQQLLIRKNQQEKVFFFQNSLENTYSDIRYISRIVDNTLKQNTTTLSNQLPKNISFFFQNLLEVTPLYQQIRLIDSTGQERIKFNQQHGLIFKTQSDRLQNKSKYAYVYESLKLQPGEIYISELELNQENGIIEKPFNPTLRIATKLESHNSGFEGIIVINISAQQIIDEMKKNAINDIYLIDQQGNYIIHPQNSKQWSAPLNHQYNFNTDFPKLSNWQQSLQNNGPIRLKTLTQQLSFYPIDSGSHFLRQWILVTASPSSNIWTHIQQEAALISTAFIGVFLSILLGSYASKRWIFHPIRYMENISQQLVEGKTIESSSSYNQNDELGSLCKKLHQMAKILSSSQDKKEHIIKSLNTEITNREKIEQDLNIYKTLFEYSSEAMMITDNNEIITHINPAYTHITGYAKDEVLGQTPRILNSGQQDKNFYTQLWQQLNTSGSWQGELLNRRKNGEIHPVYQYINSIKINNKTSLYISVFSDITQHKEFEETLKQHAYYDPLTNLANRNLLQDRLSQTIAKMYRHKQYAALLFLDLDNFKYINDSLGHDIGDNLLKKVANRLQSNFREIDSISRFGGDEFVILINDLSSDREVSHNLVTSLVNKLQLLLAQPYLIQQHELFITASIGISVFPTEEKHTPKDIIKMADMAMYVAKSEGKSTYRFYHAEMQEKSHQRLLIENGLREAIKQEQLVLFYQCQYSNEKELIGMEALVRWQHPEQGLIFPDKFIPIAEESGLIIALGESVIKQACLQLKHWEKNGHNIPHIAVNISPKQFAETNFIDKVCSICKETAVPTKQLMLELTEATIIGNIESTVTKMKKLQQLGFRISIDDFGTGYSSLAYLNRLPINQLKIDKSFVDDIALDSGKAVIVDTIIAMAQHLKLDIIAEGVENNYQFDYLIQHNCLGFQGYFFCKPVAANDVFNHLNNIHT